jgi:hypothetical protein
MYNDKAKELFKEGAKKIFLRNDCSDPTQDGNGSIKGLTLEKAESSWLHPDGGGKGRVTYCRGRGRFIRLLICDALHDPQRSDENERTNQIESYRIE